MNTTTSLISFDQSALAVTSTNRRTGGTSVRLLTAKEFKESRGLKGQDGRREYNEYLRTQGRANTAGLAAALTKGDLLVKGYRDFKGSLSVSFAKAGAIKDPKGKGGAKVTREAALAELGLSETDLLALKALVAGK